MQYGYQVHVSGPVVGPFDTEGDASAHCWRAHNRGPVNYFELFLLEPAAPALARRPAAAPVGSMAEFLALGQ